MQAEEQLAAGPPTYERSGYIVVDPLGRRYHPRDCVGLLGGRAREGGCEAHPARTTPGTPAARLCTWSTTCRWRSSRPWLGHADTAFTMRTYLHNQPDKLALAVKRSSSWMRDKKSAQ
jgi:integrase